MYMYIYICTYIYIYICICIVYIIMMCIYVICSQRQLLFDTREKERRLDRAPMSSLHCLQMLWYFNKHCFWCWPRFPTISFCDLVQYCIDIPIHILHVIICMVLLFLPRNNYGCSHFCNRDLSNPPMLGGSTSDDPADMFMAVSSGSQTLNSWKKLYNILQLAFKTIQSSCSSGPVINSMDSSHELQPRHTRYPVGQLPLRELNNDHFRELNNGNG